MNNYQHKKGNPLFAVLIVFLLGFFLINDLGIRYIYAYALLGVVFVVGILVSGIWRPGKKLRQTCVEVWNRITPIKGCFLLLVTATTVLSFLPHANIGHLVISLTISMLVFTAYFVFMEPSEKGVRRAFAAIQVMSILFALYIMAVMLWPDFYWDNIYPYLGDYVQEQADKLLPMGYGVPVGGSSTYTDYLMSIAILVNVADVFMEGAPRSRKRFAFLVASSALYGSAILLMGRRSEVLSLGAAGLMMLLLHASPRGKGDTLRKFGALALIVLLMIIILTPFAVGGYMHRYSKLIDSIIPESIVSLMEKDPMETMQPSTEMTDEPTDATQPSTEMTDEPTATDAPTEPPKPEKPKPTANQLTSGRLDLWKKALELFREKPVFGIGWEQFMNHNTYEHDVHNTYLQWLCETGIVGFVLLMVPTAGMYLITLRRTIRYRRKGCTVPYGIRRMNFVSLGMQTFLLAVNLIDPAYYHLNYFCFLALVIGLEDAAGRLEAESVARS